MIHATTKDYIEAFNRRLAEPAPTANRPVTYMVLFYRAECGLKALFSQSRKITAQPSEEQLKTLKSHNLGEIVRQLNLPANALGEGFPDFKLERERTHPVTAWATYGSDSAHTVWRYGMIMEGTAETRLVNWLNRVVVYVKNIL